MKPATTILKFREEKKHSIRYDAEHEGSCVTSLYLMKDTFSVDVRRSRRWPKTIELAIDWRTENSHDEGRPVVVNTSFPTNPDRA